MWRSEAKQTTWPLKLPSEHFFFFYISASKQNVMSLLWRHVVGGQRRRWWCLKETRTVNRQLSLRTRPLTFQSPQGCTVESFPPLCGNCIFMSGASGSKCLLCFSLLLLPLPPLPPPPPSLFFFLQVSTTWLVSTCAVWPRCSIGSLRGRAGQLTCRASDLKGPASRIQVVQVVMPCWRNIVKNLRSRLSLTVSFEQTLL